MRMLSLFTAALVFSIFFTTRNFVPIDAKVQSPPYLYEYYPQYCDLDACQNKHALCVYKPFVLRCPQNQCKVRMVYSQRQKILEMFNERRILAVNPVNMMKLSWDQDLEQLAHHWVGLRFNRTEKCRMTSLNMEYGQFVHDWSVKREDYDATTQMVSHIFGLYLKYGDLFEVIEGNTLWDGNNEEAVQLIWAKTRYIGCSYLEEFNDGHVVTVRMVCNFSPPPVFGHIIFKLKEKIDGKMLNDCLKPLKDSQRFPGLCIGHDENEFHDIPHPWYNRVRVFYNGVIMYPDYSYKYPSGVTKCSLDFLVYVSCILTILI